MVLAFPCEDWSVRQNLNSKKPGFKDELERRRQISRPMLRFVEKVCRRQRAMKKHYIVENPMTSRAWLEPPMLELAAESYPVRLHACCYGLAHPVAKQLIRKPRRLLVSHPLFAERLGKTCSGDHEHAAISGSVTYVNNNGENCTTTMSSYCNCHTSDFATAVLSAAQ